MPESDPRHGVTLEDDRDDGDFGRATWTDAFFNVLDALDIQDATDDSGLNGFHDDGRHDASSAEVFLGLRRTFNLGFEIVF